MPIDYNYLAREPDFKGSQVMVARSSDRVETGRTKALEPLFEPFLEYGRSMQVWADANKLGMRIRAGDIDTARLVKFLLASAVITSMITKIIPEPASDLPWDLGIPVIDEVLSASFLLLCAIVSGAAVYLPLRWLGGQGSMRDTIIGSAYGVGAFFPLVTLLGGVLWQVAHTEMPSGGYIGAQGWYYMQLYASIHLVSRAKAAASLAAVGILVGAMTFAALAIFST
jgi:hypothetical protein